MSFSDIRTIIIGEKGEYGRRLVRYLEKHLLPSMRVYQFTTIESFLSFEGERGLCLLEEEFFNALPQSQQELLERDGTLILLTSKESGNSFCKYHNPEKLLCRIMEFVSKDRPSVRPEQDVRRQTKLTIVYSPVYEEKLLEITQTFMRPQDVYLGAEDLGYRPDSLAPHTDNDMGDLCYYIHLREEAVLNLLEDMLITKNGVRMLPSPDMYFYLRELTGQDYEWFFDKLRLESAYGEVFWGAGNGFVASLDMLRYFDKVILIDSRENVRQNYFCERLERSMNVEERKPGTWMRIYREEIFNGTV